ncbi:MAG: virulence RhuM family protein [Bacteroidales bacterium]|nr:virulence RhuM family protein [Bacteroidales bacterium]
MGKKKELSTTTDANRRKKCDSSTLLPTVVGDKSNISTSSGEIILYQPDDDVRLEVRLNDETVWLTQAQMAELFGTGRQAITKHLKNIYEIGELERTSTSSILELLQPEGKRMVMRKREYYNLDVIISVGYRVNTKRGIQFRQWANRVLKEYLLKGYSVNNRIERLEQRVAKTEEKIDFFVRTSLPPVEGIFFDGQIFDAYTFVSDLVRSAHKQIILFDNYVDDTVLTMLDKRKPKVTAIIYTKSIPQQILLDLAKHNAQYQPIEVNSFGKAHDRFLCIDNTVYHIGASLKDLGKKWFAFSKMEMKTKELLGKI